MNNYFAYSVGVLSTETIDFYNKQWLYMIIAPKQCKQ